MAEDVEAEDELLTETDEEESEELEEETPPRKKKQKKKKGNWKNIGTTPTTFVTYPCECRWKKRFPKEPCIKYRQIRWVVLPLSDRIKQMALPLLRRLLALWLEFGDKFSPEMRERLKALLCEKYGLTPEFLEQIAEEARIAREEAAKEKGKKEKGEKKAGKSKRRGKGGKKGKKKGKGSRGKKKKGKGQKKKGKGKKKKGKKKKEKGKKKKAKKQKKKKEKKEKKEKVKKEKEPVSAKPKAKEGSLTFKKRKGGKLPFNWPYKMGSKFILSCISYLSQDPDEDFNSRATEYFDVQSMAILEQVCKLMDMPLPDPERATQYGETLVIMALNLSDWIAKYVVAPAQEISDDMVENYLKLMGKPPKIPKKNPKKKKKSPPPTAKSGDDASLEGLPRVWDELKSPVYVPPKTRVSKKRQGGDTDEEGYVTEIETKIGDENGAGEGSPRWKPQTLDDVKKEFLEYLNWYNPWTPQFMYLGPKTTPKGFEMFKIRDVDSDDVPDDLRVLNWNLNKYGYTAGYSFIPAPVPQYYPGLRPLRPVRLEDLERSGIPKEVIKQNLRFFSPWYIMSVPLKPVASPVAEAEEEPTGEDEDLEERFEDKMLKPSGPPEVKDSLWGDGKMREQLEILVHIFHLAASVPNLTIEHVFELLEEFCHAVECAESEENPSEANKLNIKKRTIILERYYFKFFGKKFRDYNDRTPVYMRVICSRLAYYIQLLYEYTARTLWELQSRPNEPFPADMSSATVDDPQTIQDWEEWIDWLLKVTKTCDEWAGWISETVEEAERKATKKKGEYLGPDGTVEFLTNDEWLAWQGEVEEKILGYRTAKSLYCKEAAYFEDKANDILPVKHWPGKKRRRKDQDEEEEEDEGSEGEWEDMEDTEKEYQENQGQEPEVTDTEETTLGETEYEDLLEDP